VFYIIQLGAVSLPGNVSKEITAALERAEAAEKYPEAVRLTGQYEAYPKGKDEMLLTELESSRAWGLEQQYRNLMQCKSEWRSFKPTAEAESPDGRIITSEVGPDTLKKAYLHYDIEKRKRDEAFRKELYDTFLPLIKIRKERREGEFVDIKGAVDLEDAVRDKLIALHEAASMWSPVYNGEGEELLNSDMVANTIDKYDTPSPELRRAKMNLENALEAAEEVLESAVRWRQSKYKDELKKVKRWKCYFRSEAIKEEIKTLEDEKNTLKESRKALIEEKARIEAEDPDSPESKTRIEVIDKTLASNGTYVKENASKLSEKITELDNAYLAENARPIWESPLFIVLAFLSGYSVEFASRLIDKMAKSYNNGDEKSPPKPGPEPGSGANAGGVSNTSA
jgi:hypothetical protein